MLQHRAVIKIHKFPMTLCHKIQVWVRVNDLARSPVGDLNGMSLWWLSIFCSWFWSGFYLIRVR